ncbi:MAG: accessory factor UbiK family protein [Pseudomonadota bacterium]
MINVKTIEGVAERIARLLPADAAVLREEFKNNAELILKNAIERMDLVTREELEIQAALLEKTQARLNELEEQLSALKASKSS